MIPAMATKWQEKNIGVSLRRGTSERKPVVNEDDGTQAGYHVEHWDDRQDAVAQPKPLRVTLKVQEEE
jgi:hypothetical protein